MALISSSKKKSDEKGKKGNKKGNWLSKKPLGKTKEEEYLKSLDKYRVLAQIALMAYGKALDDGKVKHRAKKLNLTAKQISDIETIIVFMFKFIAVLGLVKVK